MTTIIDLITMAKTQLTKTDYSLAIRYRKNDGQWSDWKEYGKGLFQGIETVQLQMRMISANYLHREKQIRFEKDGKLCNWKGEVTGKLIDL
jgi:hypothetical protein